MKYKTLIAILNDIIKRIAKKKDTTSNFRINGYQKVIDTINKFHNETDTCNVDNIQMLNLTPHMTEKIIKIIKMNKNQITKFIAEYGKGTVENDILYHQLINVMGIGPVKAKKLISEGLTTMKDLKKPKWNKFLSEDCKLFLKMKPTDKILHDDIKKIDKQISDLPFDLIIVGSYRRSVPYSSDIDILCTGNDIKLLQNIYKEMQKKFKFSYIYADGINKISMIADVSNIINKKLICKIDLFRVDVKYKISSLLYSTGSKENNIYMRKIAKSKGLLLNQYGLFKVVEKNGIKNLDRINNLKTEKDYYEYLGIKYKKPEDR